MKFRRVLTVFLLAMFLVANAHAFGVPKLGGGSKGSVDVDALVNDQSALLKSVSASLLNLAQSQTLMAGALGLKEQAAIANKNATALEAGDLTGKDDMEKQISSSQEVGDAILAKLSESEGMSEESKAEFAKSLIPYGIGSGGMVMSSKTAVENAKSLSGTKDFTVLTKLGTLLSFSKKAPTLISSFAASTSGIIKFSKANGIDTSELESATAGW